MFNKVKKDYPNAIKLKGLGYVAGTPARDLKKLNMIVWDRQTTTTITNIVKETEKSIWVEENFSNVRRLSKNRLVCVVIQDGGFIQ